MSFFGFFWGVGRSGLPDFVGRFWISMLAVAGGVPPRPPRPLGASFHYVFFLCFFFLVFRGVAPGGRSRGCAG